MILTNIINFMKLLTEKGKSAKTKKLNYND